MTKRKTSAERRYRMTESEGSALVNEWRDSGLSMAEFGTVRGVGAHRVRYWQRRLEDVERLTSAAPFVVLSTDELGCDVAPAEPDGAIEIRIDDRIHLRVPLTAASLTSVLRELRGAAS